MKSNTEKKEIVYNSAQEFIDAMKEKQKQKEEKIKNEILIHFGLIDKEKSNREYFPYYVNEKCEWDEEVGKYYIGKYVPLEVSDEEYKEILKLAEAEVEHEEEKPKKSTKWGSAIEVIAWIVLIVGIISNLVFMFTVEKPAGMTYSLEYKLAEDAVATEQWGYFTNIIYIVFSFPFLIGFAKLVAAAEKYLRK